MLRDNNIWNGNFPIRPGCKLGYLFFLATEEYINSGTKYMSTPYFVFPKEAKSLKVTLDGAPLFNEEGFKNPGDASLAGKIPSNQSYVSQLNEMNLYNTTDAQRMFPIIGSDLETGTEQAIVLDFLRTSVDKKMGGNLGIFMQANPTFKNSYNVIFIGVYTYRVLARFNSKTNKYDWEFHTLD